MMADAGRGHLLHPKSDDYTSDEGSAMDDFDTPPLSPSRRIIIEVVQKMQLEPQGFTAVELLNPCGATGTMPQYDTAASPLKRAPTPRRLAQPLSGRQMDASQNQRAQAKRTLSPASADPNKRAKTPTREQVEPTRQSRSKHPPKQKEVLILARYESTYHREQQREEKQ